MAHVRIGVQLQVVAAGGRLPFERHSLADHLPGRLAEALLHRPVVLLLDPVGGRLPDGRKNVLVAAPDPGELQDLPGPGHGLLLQLLEPHEKEAVRIRQLHPEALLEAEAADAGRPQRTDGRLEEALQRFRRSRPLVLRIEGVPGIAHEEDPLPSLLLPVRPLVRPAEGGVAVAKAEALPRERGDPEAELPLQGRRRGRLASMEAPEDPQPAGVDEDLELDQNVQKERDPARACRGDDVDDGPHR